jgi:hypothetical protein
MSILRAVGYHPFVRRVLILFLIGGLFAGCDPAPPPVTLQTVTRDVARLSSLAQLPPNKVVHAAVDSLGNVVYLVESSDGQDVMIAVSESGVPRTTQLTSANVLAAMGESQGGSGTIQSLVAGADGALYFYFVGGKGSTVRACVGRFSLRNEVVTPIHTTLRLAEISGMGESVYLARGKLIRSNDAIYLFLRHSDQWGIFEFSASRTTAETTPQLRTAYKSIRFENQPIDMKRAQVDLWPGAGSDLVITDRKDGYVWTLKPDGTATLRAFLAGLPMELSGPAVLKDDRLLFFAADSEKLMSGLDESLTYTLPRTTYPALLEFGKTITAIGQADIRAGGAFPVYAMNVREMVASPDGSFILYDQTSGQLMRMRIGKE